MVALDVTEIFNPVEVTPEKGLACSGDGVTGDCEPLMWVLGTELRSPGRAA